MKGNSQFNTYTQKRDAQLCNVVRVAVCNTDYT